MKTKGKKKITGGRCVVLFAFKNTKLLSSNLFIILAQISYSVLVRLLCENEKIINNSIFNKLFKTANRSTDK